MIPRGTTTFLIPKEKAKVSQFITLAGIFKNLVQLKYHLLEVGGLRTTR